MTTNEAFAERQKELAAIPLLKPDKRRWPNGIRSIGVEELDFVGVDLKGNLYWDGEPIELMRKLTLSFWQTIFIIAAGIGTFGLFVIEIGDRAGWWRVAQ